jgi:hypothetical protein
MFITYNLTTAGRANECLHGILFLLGPLLIG